MIGCWVINLLIPGDPAELALVTPSGRWSIEQAARYAESKAAIHVGKCAETYALEHPAAMSDGAAACDLAFEEITPLLLGASYLTGLSVTARNSLPYSDVQIMEPSDHWPRDRAMGIGNPIVNNVREFEDRLTSFMRSWPKSGRDERALLLVHHWLDALACWSLEDLYLSATTLLQIIAATEERIQNRSLSFYNAVTAASNRAGIPSLNGDFKDMRNVLIHEGSLLGGSFRGTSCDDCASVTADVLNWIDDYFHSVMAMGSVMRRRFDYKSFRNINAYSIS